MTQPWLSPLTHRIQKGYFISCLTSSSSGSVSLLERSPHSHSSAHVIFVVGLYTAALPSLSPVSLHWVSFINNNEYETLKVRPNVPLFPASWRLSGSRLSLYLEWKAHFPVPSNTINGNWENLPPHPSLDGIAGHPSAAVQIKIHT